MLLLIFRSLIHSFLSNMSAAGIIEIDMKHNHESKSNEKPEIATRLEQESNKLKEKRQSLTKEEVQTKLADAEANRQAFLNEKIKTAKELEGHPTPKK